MAKSKAAAVPDTLPTVNKDTPILVELLATSLSSKDVADNYVIDSPEMFEIATETLRDIHNAEKRATEEKEKISKPQYAAWKATNELFNPIIDRLGAAKTLLGRKLAKYEDIKAAERLAAESVAEMQRQKDIQSAQASLEAATQALADGTGSMEEFERATAAAMVAEVATPISAVDAPVSRDGHARNKRWVADVVNVPDFLEWLAKRLRMNDPTFDNTIEIKLGQLNSFGRSTEGTGKIPGVVFRDESTITARS